MKLNFKLLTNVFLLLYLFLFCMVVSPPVDTVINHYTAESSVS
jgi:hypothetical protein